MGKETTVIQMYSTLQQASAAVVDIPDDGLLLAVHLMMRGAWNAQDEGASMSLEFGSAVSREINDARSVICAIDGTFGVLTSGAAPNSVMQFFDFKEGIKIFGGERIFMHTGALGTGTFGSGRALLVISSGFIARRR